MAGRGGLWLLPPHDAATGAPQIGRDLFRTQVAGRFGIPRASWAWPADNRIALPWKQEKEECKTRSEFSCDTSTKL
uniref:Uncharacterized protein n=1 Tax=Zea mays TaxID=4577 RepID=C0P689_MAIZE|nr:unknown [Zea mays]